jgi:hypothetical protein
VVAACQAAESTIGIASTYSATRTVIESAYPPEIKAAIMVLIIENLRQDARELYNPGDTLTMRSEVRELALLEAQNLLLKTCKPKEGPHPDDFGV